MRFANEEAFMGAVIDLAHLYGWKVHHDRADMRRHTQGEPGFPDLVLVRRGVVKFRELKTTLGTLSSEQHAWHRELGPAMQVWRPEDWDQIVKELAGR